MINFKCKMCGGKLTVKEGQTVVCCDFCGTHQTLPIFDDEKKIAFYNRANSLRLRCEFDKAAGIYETLVTEYPKEAEGFWGLILCKYGIEYIDDNKSNKKIPVCHRTQYSSIFEDPDYKKTIEYSDVVARDVYEEEAIRIDQLQKHILEISSKEEPFDIFICYKETTENGERTEDSIIAYSIYKELVVNGYRVFLSRITLENQLGNYYEPYIFAALHSASLLIHVTTSKKNSEAIWVKNEWSRFITQIKDGQKKTIITCYKDVSPKELPAELRNIQGQDMSKIGAIQDLIYGVNKLFRAFKKEHCGNDNKEESSITQNHFDELYSEKVKELTELDNYCCYASDLIPLITFFEKANGYHDAEKYLLESKKQFVRRVHTYSECLQALQYIDELVDETDNIELKRNITSKAVQYRMLELQETGYAAKAMDISGTDDLYNAIVNLLSSIKEPHSHLTEFDVEIILECQKKAVELIYKNAKKIIERENDEVKLKRLATLFQELSAEIGLEKREDNYSEIASKKIEAINMARQAIERKKKIVIGVVITVIVGIIFAIVLSVVLTNKNKQKGYSADNFSIAVVSKTNDNYNESLADGYVGSGYYYTFKFDVTNDSPYDVSKIVGNMDINNAKGANLSSSTVTMTGKLKQHSMASWNIQLNVYKGEEAREIWNTDFEKLQITFKITSISFEDGTIKYYGDTRNVVVHEIDQSNLSTNNEETSPSLLEETTKDERSLIERVKDYAGENVILPDNYLTADYYTEDCGCYSYYDNDWHNSYYIFFTVSEDYHLSFWDSFVSKLVAAGYTLRDDEYGDWEYINDNTVIHFGNVRESWVEAGGHSEFQYYYFNYYAYLI